MNQPIERTMMIDPNEEPVMIIDDSTDELFDDYSDVDLDNDSVFEYEFDDFT